MAKVTEGVFAVAKPPSISSAGVLRDLQAKFNPSNFFAPWIEDEKARLEGEWSKQQGGRHSKKRRKLQNLKVKLGHGGTLDPEATGVLIVGVGSGTKALNSFLACTKTYEAVVVFGAATDSYDAWGKLVTRGPHDHITKGMVQEALGKFRGKIMQKPPVFSALKVNGKSLYKYARNGEEIPAEIQERPVEVTELEMLEWMETGSHTYQEPREGAESDVKAAAKTLLDLPAGSAEDQAAKEDAEPELSLKRKRESSTDDLVTLASSETKRLKDDEEEPTMAGALPPATGNGIADATDTTASTAKDTSDQSGSAETESAVSVGPAVRLRMTVSGGFYVRSLAHDLGKAVGSLSFMAALSRTRQGDFELGKNAMEMSEFEKGEETWAPRLQTLLGEWNSKQRSSPQ